MNTPDKTNDVDNKDNILNETFFDKYHCIKKIGHGSFCSIYKAECNGEYYALKFEKKEKSQNLLENEAVVMDYLKGPSIPHIKFYGSTPDYNILVMQLFGKNLQTLFEENKRRFSLKTVCMLGYQIISILEYIHNNHIIHRDIKPDNFVMGLNNLSQYVYLLDFGLAKKYRSSRTLRQIPFVHKKKIVGTTRYASINALSGYEQSRRDDLEAVGYVLIYFAKGHLPWQDMHVKNKQERYKYILSKKLEITSRELCEGLPEEFEKYIQYTRNLDYYDDPDYEMLKELFISVIKRNGSTFDYVYDWTTPEENLMRSESISKDDWDSNHNRISTLASMRHSGENKDENNEYCLATNSRDYRKKSSQTFSKDYNYRRENSYETDEHNIDTIFNLKRENYLETLNYDEEIVCCSSACNIF